MWVAFFLWLIWATGPMGGSNEFVRPSTSSAGARLHEQRAVGEVLRYLSVCSGIEAATVAWGPLGWKPVAFSEVERFPCAVLAHHYPDVPNLGDMTKIDGRKYRGTVDLLVGGTPCQDFSVAGKRAGLSGERSGLALDFIRLAREIAPRWLLWENVPGCLSTTSVPLPKRWLTAGIILPTESWTLSSSEFPIVAVVSSLSDILETGDLPSRYFLSPTACAGILRRDGKRGMCSLVSREEGRLLTMTERRMYWKKQASE